MKDKITAIEANLRTVLNRVNEIKKMTSIILDLQLLDELHVKIFELGNIVEEIEDKSRW